VPYMTPFAPPGTGMLRDTVVMDPKAAIKKESDELR